MQQLLDNIISVFSELCPEASQENILQAKSKTAAILAMYDIRPAQINSGNPDIAEKAKSFLAAKKLEGCSQHTLNNYALQLRVFANYIDKPIDKINTQDIRLYLASFDQHKKSSVAAKLHVIKSLFKWLTDEEIISRDPARKIKAPKVDSRFPKALSIEDLEMVREACKTLRQRALIECLYATGCRLSEMVSMNRQDINWQAGEAQVIGKGSKERTVYFSSKALYHLRKYLNIRTDANPALFITERQPYNRLSNRGVQRELKKVGELSEINKGLHSHMLRHTLATNLLNQGADIVLVQSILGHEDPGTTQVYAQMSDSRRKEQYHRYLVV